MWINATSKCFLDMWSVFAEFETNLRKERQMEGIALAKKRGVYKGRKKSLSQKQVQDLKTRIESGEKKSHLARDFGISRETLYQYLKSN